MYEREKRNPIMNDREYSNTGIHRVPQEVQDEIIHVLRLAPQISILMIHLIYKMAAVAFNAGIDAGLNRAILRIEETNIKLHSLLN
jgi:hypothetical protein